MGLDQYAWAEDSNGEKENICTWRKHPNLEGWMSDLWHSNGRPNANEDNPDEFNCITLELSRKDIDDLEEVINNNELPSTTGFFFGNNSDDYYKEQDLGFVSAAKEALDKGMRVYYSSWW